jgi:osmoprotectant transport system permease protein
MKWILDHLGELLSTTWEHLGLALIPVLIGLVISLPLGWISHRWRLARGILVPASSLLYTIPSLALFVLMPLILGTKILDPINVQAALTLYTIALLVRSVADALDAVPSEITAAATAIGFGPARRFVAVELPLSIPVLLAGVRVSAVSNIALVSVGAIIGVGGLGFYITHGAQLALPNYAEIIAGIVLIVVVALVVDGILVLLGRYLTPWTRARSRVVTA